MGSIEAAILSRLVPSSAAPLTVETARWISQLNFDPSDLKRMNDLAAKARDGSLSPEESAEIESYQLVDDFLTVLQSKARRVLKESLVATE